MVIYFYINELCGGGAERVVANLANYFSGNDDCVTIINSYPTKNDYYTNKEVNRLYLFENRLSSNRLIRNMKLIRKLRLILKNGKPDVVISFMQEPNMRTCLANIGLHSKCIISVRNDPKKEYPGFFGKIISRFILPLSDGCVFQTKEAQEWFSKKIQRNSTILMNYVDASFFDVERSSNTCNIVSCGRLSEQKNQKMLINAFDLIKDFISDNLLIYGEGNLQSELQDFIREKGLTGRVFLMGYTSNVIESIKDASVFVLSSDYEGMPNALMEAMAIGIPCVSTDCPCGGPKEIITSGHDGFLVECGDEKSMADNIKEIVQNRDYAITIGKNAKEKAKLLFDEEIVKNKWRIYVNRVLNGR